VSTTVLQTVRNTVNLAHTWPTSAELRFRYLMHQAQLWLSILVRALVYKSSMWLFERIFDRLDTAYCTLPMHESHMEITDAVERQIRLALSPQVAFLIDQMLLFYISSFVALINTCTCRETCRMSRCQQGVMNWDV